MVRQSLVKAQQTILKLVAARYGQVYLVGGTAISLRYRHRVSEDLDFFTRHYTRALHREMAAFIRRKTGYASTLVQEETRRRYIPMAVYEFEISRDAALKIDIVSDVAPLLQPRGKDGIASMDDLSYRNVLAVIGWTAGTSETGRALAGGRQTTKDLFDLWYLSQHVERLSEWFPKHCDRAAYERLVAWYLGLPKQKTIGELLELVPGCDTKAVFGALDQQIIHQLNRVFLRL
jgi:hypothetical protein